MKFTDKAIANLKPKKKQFYLREAGGFTVRVLPSGIKTWLLIYTVAGKRRQMNLGEYRNGDPSSISLAEARNRATQARSVLNAGDDPQDAGFAWHRNPERERREAEERAEANEKNPTFKALADDYIQRHASVNKRASSAQEDQRLLDKDILPTWGKRKAADIRKRDVVKLLETTAKRGNYLTHNIFKLVRKIYNFAISRDILETTPCIGIKIDEIATITSRDRVLREAKDNGGVDEILTFWRALDGASMMDEVKRALRLILVTGQRPGEVIGMHSDEITTEQREQKDSSGKVLREWTETWWTIPVSRRKVKEHGKNKPTAHRVYLTDLALELIGDREGYIFPSPVVALDDQGEQIIKPIRANALAYAIRRNLKDYQPRRPIKGKTLAIVQVKESRKMALEHFTPHDLRRTCATRLASLGFGDEVIDAVLGHVKQGIVAVYNRHDYSKEKRSAMEAWERKLNSLLTGAESNVIPLKRKRG